MRRYTGYRLTVVHMAAIVMFVLGGGVAIGAVIAARIGPLDDGAEDAAVPEVAVEAPAVPVAELDLAPGQEEVALHRVVADGPFELELGTAVVDRERDVVLVGVRATNRGSRWHQAGAATYALVGPDGEEHQGIASDVPMVPPGLGADLTIEVTGAADLPLDDPATSFVVGGGGRSAATVPLGPAGEPPPDVADAALLPVEVPLDLWVSDHIYTWHVTRARLLAASPTTGIAPPEGQRVLELQTDWWAAGEDVARGYFAAEHFRIRHPDGTEAEVVGASADARAVYSYTAVEGGTVELPVPVDLDGGDLVLLVSGRSLGLGATGEGRRWIEQPLALGDAGSLVGEVAVSDRPPVPVLPGDDGYPPAAPDGEVALDAGTLRTAGWELTPTAVRVDGGDGTVSVDAVLRRPPGTETTGDLELYGPGDAETWPGSVALVAGDTLLDLEVATGEAAAPVIGDPDGVEVTWEASVGDRGSRLDLDRLALAASVSGDGAPAVLPLTEGSLLPASPAPANRPEHEPLSLAANEWQVTIDEVVVDPAGFGAEPPAGFVAVELTVDGTLSGEQSRGLGEGSIFLRRPDGWLTQVISHRGDIVEAGGSLRTAHVFWVPAPLPPALTVVLRGYDERADGASAPVWTEVSAPLRLEGGGDATPTPEDAAGGAAGDL